MLPIDSKVLVNVGIQGKSILVRVSEGSSYQESTADMNIVITVDSVLYVDN